MKHLTKTLLTKFESNDSIPSCKNTVKKWIEESNVFDVDGKVVTLKKGSSSSSKKRKSISSSVEEEEDADNNGSGDNIDKKAAKKAPAKKKAAKKKRRRLHTLVGDYLHCSEAKSYWSIGTHYRKGITTTMVQQKAIY